MLVRGFGICLVLLMAPGIVAAQPRHEYGDVEGPMARSVVLPPSAGPGDYGRGGYAQPGYGDPYSGGYGAPLIQVAPPMERETVPADLPDGSGASISTARRAAQGSATYGDPATIKHYVRPGPRGASSSTAARAAEGSQTLP